MFLLLNIGAQEVESLSNWIFLTHWDGDYEVMTCLALLFFWYVIGLFRLRVTNVKGAIPASSLTYFAASYLFLIIALLSPVSAVGEEMFFWLHVVQHMLLMLVVAPLFLLSNSMPEFMWALPRPIRYSVGGFFAREGAGRKILKVLTKPYVALPIFVIVLDVWHVPAAYDLALTNDWVHYFEHMTFIVAGILFWWPLIGPAPLRSQLPIPLRIFYLLIAMAANTLLAIFLTFHGPIYTFYADVTRLWNMSMATDQELGGLIMWVVGMFIFLIAMSIVFFQWVDKEEREEMRWKAIEQKRANYAAKLARRQNS